MVLPDDFFVRDSRLELGGERGLRGNDFFRRSRVEGGYDLVLFLVCADSAIGGDSQ